MIISEKSKSLEEQVYLRLEEDILCGVYKRGDALTENALSHRLGVSRTPVRAALHRLGEEGLVELIPHKCAVVIGVTIEDLVDTYRIRMRLEGLATAMATGRLTRDDERELREVLSNTEKCTARVDADRIKELDTTFHSIIYRASGNRMLCRILSELHRNTRTYRKLSLAMPGRLEKSLEEHRAILEAMLEGDSDRADSLTSLHIEEAMKAMVEAMRRHEETSRTPV
ncbi:MAG: GntR family transcriptional regulator [Clostridia bacterium]|nr:GntR family transcriptional regulator [Clostridia bacterium]